MHLHGSKHVDTITLLPANTTTAYEELNCCRVTRNPNMNHHGLISLWMERAMVLCRGARLVNLHATSCPGAAPGAVLCGGALASGSHASESGLVSTSAFFAFSPSPNALKDSSHPCRRTFCVTVPWLIPSYFSTFKKDAFRITQIGPKKQLSTNHTSSEKSTCPGLWQLPKKGH